MFQGITPAAIVHQSKEQLQGRNLNDLADCSGDQPPPLLQYLAGSPLFASGAISAYGVEAPFKLPDRMIWVKSPKDAINVFDFEPVAHKNVPPAHFGYMTSGIDDGVTLRANREGFLKFQLLPRRLNLPQPRGGSLLEFCSCALPALESPRFRPVEEKAAFDHQSVSDLSHPGRVSMWPCGLSQMQSNRRRPQGVCDVAGVCRQ
jgi:hypothetical protein